MANTGYIYLVIINVTIVYIYIYIYIYVCVYVYRMYIQTYTKSAHNYHMWLCEKHCSAENLWGSLIYFVQAMIYLWNMVLK